MRGQEQTHLEELLTADVQRISAELLEAAEDTQKQAQLLYAELPQMENLEPLEQMADSLKSSAGTVSRALAQIYAVSDELSARCRDIALQRKKRKLLGSAPANSTIDLEENASEHFAKGLGIYKLLLVCFIGSFAGVMIELLWCLITNGYLESRAGLVYGPFNLLYGVGAAALTACLYRFRNRGPWISFLGGMIVGTVVEYICSWGQEVLFGSRSWDYSHMPFNLNGRVCLLYSSFWGILGVLWIKDLYPRMAKWILKLPNRAGKVLTVLLAVFFAFNAAMSLAAVYRWSERVEGLAPSGSFEEFLDDRFPDERMERIFANMDFSRQNDRLDE